MLCAFYLKNQKQYKKKTRFKIKKKTFVTFDFAISFFCDFFVIEKKIIKYNKRNNENIIMCKTRNLIFLNIETKIITINNL